MTGNEQTIPIKIAGLNAKSAGFLVTIEWDLFALILCLPEG